MSDPDPSKRDTVFHTATTLLHTQSTDANSNRKDKDAINDYH